jgi:hypothetical protein
LHSHDSETKFFCETLRPIRGEFFHNLVIPRLFRERGTTTDCFISAPRRTVDIVVRPKFLTANRTRFIHNSCASGISTTRRTIQKLRLFFAGWINHAQELVSAERTHKSRWQLSLWFFARWSRTCPAKIRTLFATILGRPSMSLKYPSTLIACEFLHSAYPILVYYSIHRGKNCSFIPTDEPATPGHPPII